MNASAWRSLSVPWNVWKPVVSTSMSIMLEGPVDLSYGLGRIELYPDGGLGPGRNVVCFKVYTRCFSIANRVLGLAHPGTKGGLLGCLLDCRDWRGRHCWRRCLRPAHLLAGKGKIDRSDGQGVR